MDYDFFLRAYRAGARAKKIAIPLSVMRLVGVSSQLDWSILQKRFMEERLAHLNNCAHVRLKVLYKIYWLLYPLYRRSRSLIGDSK